MASSTSSQVCRFCGEENDVIVDLIETGLCEKLVRFFPLKVSVYEVCNQYPGPGPDQNTYYCFLLIFS